MSSIFESVAEAQRRARRRLPAPIYAALIQGAQSGITLADNVAAFGELGIAPHVAGLPAERDQATSVMGQRISLPVIISPTGVRAVHPLGEVAVARAAAAYGTAIGLSAYASKPIEEVVAANPRLFAQLYWSGSRRHMIERMDRARSAGAVGAIVTLDWSFSLGRDWGSPVIPDKLDLKTALRFAPHCLAKPRWLATFLKAGTIPDLTVPNMAVAGGAAPTFMGAYREWRQTPPPTWDDVAWLAREWGGPVMLKGITRVDDAKRAVDSGAAAISVSNHGGNNVDTTPASIRLLPAIAAAVGSQLEVVLDGGVRRGSDVVKAVALGARAVMIGRAYLWGLAVNGQAGVENVLDILRAGIDSTLHALGRASIHDLSADDLIVPAGFTRQARTGAAPASDA
jgi:pre-mycofactocin synthase